MSTTSALSRIPVIRILVPFVLGILCHRLWHSIWAPSILFLLALGGLLWLNAKSKSPQGRLRWRPYFIMPIATCAIALGWLCAIVHCPAHLTEGQRKDRVLTGRVVNLEFTDFSMRMTIDVLNIDLPQCRVLISTRGCDYTMQAGDIVAWQAALDEVGPMGNPEEMDYASFLLDSEGIRYQQHLPVGQVRHIGHSPTLITRMANVRRNLQLSVFNSRLSPATQQFISALLLGNKGIIDKSTRQEFSSAGVAHVLALSGLHVGFIALIIWWLLFPLDYLHMKKLRLAITLAAIILFAVFTGLSPSVVRATVMIGVVFSSLIFYRRSVSLNSLFLAALIILTFSPSALYSVGFQLSFITVGAVLVFARLPEAITSRYNWVNYITSTAITASVAMLATVALSAHYFHTVSLMSVISNLLILPVLPVFMVLGAIFLLVTAAGLQCIVLDKILDGTYHYIHWVTRTINATPGSHLGNVYVSTFGVVAYFVMLALLILWFYRRDFRILLAAGCAIIIMLAHSLWIDYRTPRQGLVIFNSFSSTPILYFDNGTGYVWTPDEEEPDSSTFARYYAGFLSRHSIDKLQFIADGDSLNLDGNMIHPPYALLMGKRMLAIGGGKWKQATTNHRLTLDDIIITKRYHGTVAKLKELYRFDRLILSGAIHDKERLKVESDSLGCVMHDLSAQGAITLSTD